jgi:lipopolysaccharide transport system ATP-binding protein
MEDPYLKIGDINDRSVKGTSEYVWALKDINFEVEQGEVLGIIGKNGAGKSTLLKILSKVTAPTTGRITYKGRIASLLEVGTGFHPELTGRENVFLNGAILGMRKSEIISKFDEIVDFSGCERYIDTPVKRYSSGMAVRLGFAVAAFLEPEILIIDEVLAVGDAEFQRKAIGKMQEVSQLQNRTVLFVSHNMSAIQSLTNRVILINDGNIASIGKTREVINEYLQFDNNEINTYKDLSIVRRKGTGEVLFVTVVVNNNKPISTGSNLNLTIRLKNSSSKEVKNARIDIGIDNSQNTRIAYLSNHILDKVISLLPYQEIELLFKVEKIPLSAGKYGLTLYCEVAGQIQDWVKNAIYFEIRNIDFYKTGRFPQENQGSILLKYHIEKQ